MTSANQTSTSQPSSGVEVLESQSVNMRSRKRKESLSDLIPVERIANVDRQEAFEEATKDLNKEISDKSDA